MNLRRMNPASFARSPRFPAVAIGSEEEFQLYLRENQSVMDARNAYTRSLATGDVISCKGTCAPCLRPSTFTSSTQDGEQLPDGRRVPNWNRHMRCDCEDQMSGRERALIHFLQATVLTPWTHMLLLGPSSRADRRLNSLAEVSTSVQPLRQPGESINSPLLDAPSTNFHCVVAQDCLDLFTPPQAALGEVLRVLVPGGKFVFTIPFQFAASSDLLGEDADNIAADAPADFRGSGHKLGWELLPLLKQNGFRVATAYLYWSEELGYLGSMNFLFSAVK